MIAALAKRQQAGGRCGACEAHGDETRARGRMRQKATPFLVPTGPMVRMTAAGTWTLRGKALEREGRASGLAPPGSPTAVLAIHGHLRDMPHTGRHRISVALRACASTRAWLSSVVRCGTYLPIGRQTRAIDNG